MRDPTSNVNVCAALYVMPSTTKASPAGLVPTVTAAVAVAAPTSDVADPGAERLDPVARNRLDVLLAFGDPCGELYEAWVAKEAVRDLYTLADRPELAAVWLDAVIADAKASTVPEVKGLARTL